MHEVISVEMEIQLQLYSKYNKVKKKNSGAEAFRENNLPLVRASHSLACPRVAFAYVISSHHPPLGVATSSVLVTYDV
jgi:hypothetical protein